jgi:hypothetical protein
MDSKPNPLSPWQKGSKFVALKTSYSFCFSLNAYGPLLLKLPTLPVFLSMRMGPLLFLFFSVFQIRLSILI